MIRQPPISTLFPSTTLFRSRRRSTRPWSRRSPASTTAPRRSSAEPEKYLLRHGRACPGHPRFKGLKTWIPEQVRRSEEHTSELQSRQYLVCRLLLEKKKNKS